MHAEQACATLAQIPRQYPDAANAFAGFDRARGSARRLRVTPNSATPGDAVALSLEEGAAAIRALLAPGETSLLIAVSGGPDSLVLIACCSGIWHALRPRIAWLSPVFDHGLRRESATEAQVVARQAESLGLACRILRWEATPKPRHGFAGSSAPGPLRAAGTRRHAGSGRRPSSPLHTCDDQAETVLMRIAAGSGIDGLAGMAARTAAPPPETERRIMLARPFLGIAKIPLAGGLHHLSTSRLYATRPIPIRALPGPVCARA